ncbi:MAG: hypothetical protein [Caudoviricetes sp.]|nr:MAG: hypothetical protein [Caudoviricetes sp.]
MQQLYDVYINCHLKATSVTEQEAWDVIGKQPFGSGHIVRLAGTNKIAVQFIPY